MVFWWISTQGREFSGTKLRLALSSETSAKIWSKTRGVQECECVCKGVGVNLSRARFDCEMFRRRRKAKGTEGFPVLGTVLRC